MTRDLFEPDEPRRVPYRGGTALRIGRDLEADILVLDDGSVVASLPSREWPINTTLDAYRSCVRPVGALRDALAAGSIADEDQAIDELEAELWAVDPEAIATPGAYWPIIVEQLRDQLF